jgi:hypothetical protein
VSGREGRARAHTLSPASAPSISVPPPPLERSPPCNTNARAPGAAMRARGAAPGRVVSATAPRRHRVVTPTAPRPRRPPPARTSEFWYEEEDEFDAVADALRAKTVWLATVEDGDDGGDGDGGVAAAATSLASVDFDAAFRAPAVADAAVARLWAGRGGAPLFIKPRARWLGGERRRERERRRRQQRRPTPPPPRRAALDAAAASPAAADAVWAELAGQNWRVRGGDEGRREGGGSNARPRRAPPPHPSTSWSSATAWPAWTPTGRSTCCAW